MWQTAQNQIIPGRNVPDTEQTTGRTNMRSVQLRAASALLLLLIPVSSSADEVDRYVESQLNKLGLPGLSLAVTRQGKIVKSQGYGKADLELNAPATSASLYEIGSLTKQFTAAAIMLLAEEEKLALSDSVLKYFPGAPPSWKPITIRHLLNHTSGIRNHVAVPGYLDVFTTNLSGVTQPRRDELLRMFFQLPLEFEPGKTWAYDNTGYYLLGIIVEEVSGESLWQFFNNRIFDPLEMTATRNTDPSPIVNARTSGYGLSNGTFENRPVLLPDIAFSAGSLLSNVADMARWDAALYGETLLQRSTLETQWTAARDPDGETLPFDYGLGWFVSAYKGHRIIQHSGGTPGFSSVFYRFSDDGLGVIILANSGDRILDQMALDIAGMYVPALKRPERSDDPDPGASDVVRDTVARLLKGEHDVERFTLPMHLFLETTTGKGFWEWIASHGEMTSLTYSEMEHRNDGKMLRYRMTLGANPYWLSVRMTRDGKISQITWW